MMSPFSCFIMFLAYCCNSQPTSSPTLSYDSTQCSVEFNIVGTSFDLCSLTISDNVGQIKYYKVTDTRFINTTTSSEIIEYMYYYYFNIAGKLPLSGIPPICSNPNDTHQYCPLNADCSNNDNLIIINDSAWAYQVRERSSDNTMLKCWALSNQYGGPPQWSLIDQQNPSFGVQLTYINGDYEEICKSNRIFNIQFKCENNARYIPVEVPVYEYNPCEYTIIIPSTYGCPVECAIVNNQLCAGHGVCGFSNTYQQSRCLCFNNFTGNACDIYIGDSTTAPTTPKPTNNLLSSTEIATNPTTPKPTNNLFPSTEITTNPTINPLSTTTNKPTLNPIYTPTLKPLSTSIPSSTLQPVSTPTYIDDIVDCPNVNIDGSGIPLNVCIGARNYSLGAKKSTLYKCNDNRNGIMVYQWIGNTNCNDSTSISKSIVELTDVTGFNCDGNPCDYYLEKVYGNETESCAQNDNSWWQQYVIIDQCIIESRERSIKLSYDCDSNSGTFAEYIGNNECKGDAAIIYNTETEECYDDGLYHKVLSSNICDTNTTKSISDPTGAIIGSVIIGIFLIFIGVGLVYFLRIYQKKQTDKNYMELQERPNQDVVVRKLDDLDAMDIMDTPLSAGNDDELVSADNVIPSAPPLEQDVDLIDDDDGCDKEADIDDIADEGEGEGDHDDDKYNDIENFFYNKLSNLILDDDKRKYFQLFKKNGFDTIEIIKTLTDQDLKDIGINKFGHRKVILTHLQHKETNS